MTWQNGLQFDAGGNLMTTGGGSSTPSVGPAAGSINNADVFAFFQGGTYKSVTAQILASYVASSLAGTYLSAAPASGSTNDYNPAGFGATVNRLDLDTTAGNATLTGLIAGTDNQIVLVSNTGANNLTLDATSSASSAANRFRASDLMVIPPNGSMYVIYYGGTVNRWVIAP